MPKQYPDAELAFHKLGQRIREGYARKHPAPDKILKTVEDALLEKHKQEHKSEREKVPVPDTGKRRERESQIIPDARTHSSEAGGELMDEQVARNAACGKL